MLFKCVWLGVILSDCLWVHNILCSSHAARIACTKQNHIFLLLLSRAQLADIPLPELIRLFCGMAWCPLEAKAPKDTVAEACCCEDAVCLLTEPSQCVRVVWSLLPISSGSQELHSWDERQQRLSRDKKCASERSTSCHHPARSSLTPGKDRSG